MIRTSEQSLYSGSARTGRLGQSALVAAGRFGLPWCTRPLLFQLPQARDAPGGPTYYQLLPPDCSSRSRRVFRGVSGGTHGVRQLRAGCSSTSALRGTFMFRHAALASDAPLLKVCRGDEEAAAKHKHIRRQQSSSPSSTTWQDFAICMTSITHHKHRSSCPQLSSHPASLWRLRGVAMLGGFAPASRVP